MPLTVPRVWYSGWVMRPPRDIPDTLKAKDSDTHIRLPQDAQDRLRGIARARGIPFTVLVRWLVLEGLRELEEAS